MDIPERTCKTNKIAGVVDSVKKQRMTLTHLSLFTGIGGIDIAAEWAGFKTIGQVERNEYANKILRLRFGDIPRWDDIHDVSADDVRRKTGVKRPTLITGGFPCQPFSTAGKRRGKEDDRYLWPEMLRVVSELRPAWVVGENVAGIVSMALDDCLSDLEGEGYAVRAFLIPACAVGAWHRRDRVFIVATDARHVPGSTEQELQQAIPEKPVTSSTGQLYPKTFTDTDSSKTTRQQQHGGKMLCKGSERPCQPSGMVPDTDSPGLQGHRGFGEKWECSDELFAWTGCKPFEGIWESEPRLGRLAHGVPHRVDRLRCLGNAVVPQHIYPILKAIAEIEI